MTRDWNPSPEYLESLAKAKLEPIDFDVSLDDRPDWLDPGKLKKGREFAERYLTCLGAAGMMATTILYASKAHLQTFIFTERFHTPSKAFSKYFPTFQMILSFLQEDFLSEGRARTNMTIARALHKNAYRKMTKCSQSELDKRVSLGNEEEIALWCPVSQVIAEDMQRECPIGSSMFEDDGKVWMNQFRMVMAQTAMSGLPLTYPEKFGIHNVTDEDLDGYRHVWQLIAHYMGIKDEYNLCSGDIDQVRRRTKDILEVIVKPTLRDIDAEWEHMCRCAFDGFSFFFPIFEFELPLQILCQILNIQTPCFNKSLTFKQRSAFHFFRLALGYFFRVPGVLTFANYFFRHYLKRYKELTPEERRSVEEKQYPYMNQPFKKQLV